MIFPNCLKSQWDSCQFSLLDLSISSLSLRRPAAAAPVLVDWISENRTTSTERSSSSPSSPSLPPSSSLLIYNYPLQLPPPLNPAISVLFLLLYNHIITYPGLSNWGGRGKWTPYSPPLPPPSQLPPLLPTFSIKLSPDDIENLFVFLHHFSLF